MDDPTGNETPLGPDVVAAAPTPEARVAELEATVSAMEHEALIAHDMIAGLRAELSTVLARIALLDATDVGKAYARIDQLEDEREARVHELHWEIKLHREAMARVREEIVTVKQSSTWKVGSVVVRPLAKLTGRIKP